MINHNRVSSHSIVIDQFLMAYYSSEWCKNTKYFIEYVIRWPIRNLFQILWTNKATIRNLSIRYYPNFYVICALLYVMKLRTVTFLYSYIMLYCGQRIRRSWNQIRPQVQSRSIRTITNLRRCKNPKMSTLRGAICENR